MNVTPFSGSGKRKLTRLKTGFLVGQCSKKIFSSLLQNREKATSSNMHPSEFLSRIPAPQQHTELDLDSTCLHVEKQLTSTMPSVQKPRAVNLCLPFSRNDLSEQINRAADLPGMAAVGSWTSGSQFPGCQELGLLGHTWSMQNLGAGAGAEPAVFEGSLHVFFWLAHPPSL